MPSFERGDNVTLRKAIVHNNTVIFPEGSRGSVVKVYWNVLGKLTVRVYFFGEYTGEWFFSDWEAQHDLQNRGSICWG
jgi:hypothetical protein